MRNVLVPSPPKLRKSQDPNPAQVYWDCGITRKGTVLAKKGGGNTSGCDRVCTW